MTLLKYCTQYASKSGKHQWHRTGKGQFSFQSQRRAMSKNAQTTRQLCSFHMLAGASQVVLVVKKKKKTRMPMQEMRVPSLIWEDPLEEGMATHSSILAWIIPWIEEFGGLQSIGSQRVRHDWSDLACTHAHTSKVILKILQAIYPSTVCEPRNSRCTSLI